MKNSVVILLVIWMVLAVVDTVAMICFPPATLFFKICGWCFAALNASVFVSFTSMLAVEFKDRRLAKKYPAEEDE